MKLTSADNFQRLRAQLPEIQAALRELGLDAWLLFDLHARNAVSSGLLGLGDLTRRYFVLLPAQGEPQAVVHGIEEVAWAAWPWARRRYVGWRELDLVLRDVLDGRRRIAMEISAGDAVPSLDLVPAGVVELVRAAGADVVSSGDLITRFYSRWMPAQLESHRRAAAVLVATARDAFARVRAELDAGREVWEGELRQWVLDTLAARGCGVGQDCIVGAGPNSANPHYEPAGRGARVARDQVLLLDLWAKESEEMVYADQTWMAYTGAHVPERVRMVWDAVRAARDGAVDFLRERWRTGTPVRGADIDDVARGVIAQRGFGPSFIHRTGHSIDRATHGMGPNIDNLETRDDRRLIEGVGFSIEPGIYLSGEFGLRSEINVHLGEAGPEVSPPEPQAEIYALGSQR